MAIGGLMAYAFWAFLGNPDIMAALITWAVLSTIALTVITVFKDTEL